MKHNNFVCIFQKQCFLLFINNDVELGFTAATKRRSSYCFFTENFTCHLHFELRKIYCKVYLVERVLSRIQSGNRQKITKCESRRIKLRTKVMS